MLRGGGGQKHPLAPPEINPACKLRKYSQFVVNTFSQVKPIYSIYKNLIMTLYVASLTHGACAVACHTVHFEVTNDTLYSFDSRILPKMLYLGDMAKL